MTFKHVRLLNTLHFKANSKNSDGTQNLLTFVAVSESPLLARLDVGYPQVVIVDEGYEVRISRADLGVHACP